MNYPKNAVVVLKRSRLETARGTAIDLGAVARETLTADDTEHRLLSQVISQLERVIAGEERPMRLVRQALASLKALEKLNVSEDARHAQLWAELGELIQTLEAAPEGEFPGGLPADALTASAVPPADAVTC